MARPRTEDLVRTLEARGITDTRVLAAFRAVDRARFVPRGPAGAAYQDRPLRIPHGQVTTQPSLIALMVEALRVAPEDCVLEVGTGFGFEAAVLARLCRLVVSIERFDDMARAARENLANAAVANVVVLVGDGTMGAPAYAPFQRMIGAAAAPGIPGPLAGQLAEGGRAVPPVGPGGSEEVLVFEKRRGGLVRARRVVPASFVPMIGAHGHPEG